MCERVKHGRCEGRMIWCVKECVLREWVDRIKLLIVITQQHRYFVGTLVTCLKQLS